jgi:hypothetical protein
MGTDYTVGTDQRHEWHAHGCWYPTDWQLAGDPEWCENARAALADTEAAAKAAYDAEWQRRLALPSTTRLMLDALRDTPDTNLDAVDAILAALRAGPEETPKPGSVGEVRCRRCHVALDGHDDSDHEFDLFGIKRAGPESGEAPS